MFEVVRSGLLDTIQDRGRLGYSHLGVPQSGPCDPWSLAVANALLGNVPGAPALEMTLAGPTLAVHRTAVVALSGADFEARVPEEERSLAVDGTALLRAGTTLAFGRPVAGARGYLAVPGGFVVEPVLGSAATYRPAFMGGLAGRALRPRDRLVAAGPSDPALAGRRWPADGLIRGRGGTAVVRLVAGPHAELLSGLVETSWRVAVDSDRAGLRLEPERGRGVVGGEVTSLPMTFGALQLPPDGRPIVLLADHQTVGGYPVAGVAVSADHRLLGQVRPGDRLRFEIVLVDEAQRLARAQEALFLRVAAALEDAPWSGS
jgi:biotin-dependent carboxylase-like uncharacterized protein